MYGITTVALSMISQAGIRCCANSHSHFVMVTPYSSHIGNVYLLIVLVWHIPANPEIEVHLGGAWPKCPER